MKTLSTDGRQKVTDIAARYNLQPQTVESLLKAIIRGNGTMAQFDLPELGGQGQWMKGGMTMVGDMFNASLRSTVDKLCNELADLVTSSVVFTDDDTSAVPNKSVAAPDIRADNTWPTVFGSPTSTGSQNNFRYAYFATVHRLVIEENGKRTIYDTLHHHITGVSQQQGVSDAYHFTSREGIVDLNALKKVSDPDAPKQSTPEMTYDVNSTAGPHSQDRSPQDIVMATIEKLNILFEKGQITEEEFTAKKQEMLSRL
ncbi:Short C-terminal domain-containing protein [Dyadobacter soli]|uniref:Short C-terminal domain-containing protein n=1 Tax=Dyadobacter soli TaxID=659014 RepID=A0A1G8A1G6_9BACT|nr:SHOCT domain-containing protein [Dyadobacter soli]SDH14815.1 Short C-terminal domain-containing protein [Dyadobacter soli]